MNFSHRAWLPLCLAVASQAQTSAPKVDVYTAEQLVAAAHTSDPKLPQGIVEHYPNHYTMFIVRHENGQSEWHEHLADTFFIVDGKAQLCTGGNMVEDKITAPGERRGAGLNGATCVALKRGDVAHIPAGVPHQVRMASGETFTYFVVKVAETATN